MQHLINAENLQVTRKQQIILREVSLSIGTGDFVTIIGPNGAGKTMLLKCLMGFYQPDSGSVTQRPGIKIGYMPQRLELTPMLAITTRRFIALRKNATADAIAAAVAETEIEDLLDRPIHVLSSGQLQRVLVARALLENADVLVLDEPAQNLDIPGQLAFYRLLERIYRERNVSILLVSHDLHFVMRCSRRVLCLFQHICCQGAPQAVSRDPAFIALFGEDMARMMAVYQHSHDHHHHDVG